MSSIKAPLSLKIKNSAQGVVWVLKRPAYLLFALVSGFIFSGLISLVLKIDILRLFLFELPLPVLERVDVVWDLFTDVYVSYSFREAFGIILISLLFGIVLSLVLYSIRHRETERVGGTSSGIGVAMGAISGGCAACGTSLLAPFLSAIGITTTASALQFGFVLNIIAALLMLNSIYSLGSTVAVIKQKQLTKV
jgi:hypothetical protein